jgi:uncharacterized protein YraI
MRIRTFSIAATATALAILLTLMVGLISSAQDTGVYAEAVSFANLRAGTGIDFDVMGEISSGTRYPVVGRSALYPWILLGDRETFQPIGWVFRDITTLYGELTVVPVTEQILSTDPTPPPLPTSTIGQAPPADSTPQAQQASATPQPPTATLASNVIGLVNGEINLRYGPGADYARLGVAQPGDSLSIVGYHTTLPWVLLDYPSAPNGVAWVARDVIEIQGDYRSTQPISQTDFRLLPTLTPTPALVTQSSIAGDSPAVPLSVEFAALANGIWNFILSRDFDPETSRFAAFYLKNLSTGEEVTVGNQFAFSGTSLNKVPILAALFNVMPAPPDYQTAVDIANTMICSENVATNSLLSRIGGGDMYAGADAVTTFLTQLGLTRTFLTAPFETPGRELPPPPRPIRFPTTTADQSKTAPNVTNQMTVDEMGYLLDSIYECAVDESGPLLDKFDTFTPQECRKMLHVMAENTVPAGIPVSHKHGWVNDTHGNAAIVYTPGGDYVLVMMAYQPEWLNYFESFPLIAEVSRSVYNYLNPAQPLGAIRDGSTPPTETCNYTGSALVDELISPYFAEDALPELAIVRPQP